jgi:hypothetical protein
MDEDRLLDLIIESLREKEAPEETISRLEMFRGVWTSGNLMHMARTWKIDVPLN